MEFFKHKGKRTAWILAEAPAGSPASIVICYRTAFFGRIYRCLSEEKLFSRSTSCSDEKFGKVNVCLLFIIFFVRSAIVRRPALAGRPFTVRSSASSPSGAENLIYSLRNATSLVDCVRTYVQKDKELFYSGYCTGKLLACPK